MLWRRARRRQFRRLRRPSDVREDPLDSWPIHHDRDDAPRLAALRTPQREALVSPREQHRPAARRAPVHFHRRWRCGLGRSGCRQPRARARLIEEPRRCPRRQGRSRRHLAKRSMGCQHAAVAVLVQPRKGHQLREQAQRLDGGRQQLGAAVRVRAAQAVDQGTFVEAPSRSWLSGALAKRRTGSSRHCRPQPGIFTEASTDQPPAWSVLSMT